MAHGAGYAALRGRPDVEIVDPRESAVGEIASTYARYPHIGPVLPALGYGPSQLAELRATINASRAGVVLAATPIDLARLGGFERPIVRARYRYSDAGTPKLDTLVLALLTERE